MEIADVVKEKEKAVEQQEFERAAKLRDKQEKLKEALLEKKALWRKSKAEERLLVDEATIVEVIATMTGIPLSRLEEEESKKTPQSGRRIAQTGHRPGPGAGGGRKEHPAVAGRSAQRATPDRVVYFPRPDGRGENRAGQNAGRWRCSTPKTRS